jgi:hypothetical protein
MSITGRIAFKLPVILMTGFIALLSFNQQAVAQQKPPRPISVVVNPLDALKFGAFYQGISGGTVTVSETGSRSVSGDVIQLNMGSSFTPAIFEVQALPGTLIHIVNGPNATLTGPGGSMTLTIGTASTGPSFITTLNSTYVKIGGTLLVKSPSANPPGNYSGTFTVTFIQE